MVAMGAAIATLNIALGLDRPVPFAWAPTPYVVAAGLIVAGLATVVLPVLPLVVRVARGDGHGTGGHRSAVRGAGGAGDGCDT